MNILFIYCDDHALQQRRAAPQSLHFIIEVTPLLGPGGAPFGSGVSFTLNIKYLSFLFGYLYTGHENIVLSRVAISIFPPFPPAAPALASAGGAVLIAVTKIIGN